MTQRRFRVSHGPSCRPLSCLVIAEQLAALQHSLPSLRELHACSNGIACLASSGDSSSDAPVQGFQQLQVGGCTVCMRV